MIPREPEEDITNAEEAMLAEEVSEEIPEDGESLKKALTEEKTKAAGYLANWQRAQADFINYKRRSEQEKEETAKFANSMLMLSLLPVLDDLERAFAAVPPKLAKLSWIDGIGLIERKLGASLKALGLSQIKALGEPFDPRLHEAIRQDKGEEGMVIDEVQKGYKLHDRVLRPAMVVVGNGEEAKKEE